MAGPKNRLAEKRKKAGADAERLAALIFTYDIERKAAKALLRDALPVLVAEPELAARIRLFLERHP